MVMSRVMDTNLGLDSDSAAPIWAVPTCGDGEARRLPLLLTPTPTTSDNCLPARIWVISHNHLLKPSSSPPCGTTKSRRASHWPITHSQRNYRTATRSSPLPQCFKIKHECSMNFEGIMGGSPNPSRVLWQFCTHSLLVPPLSAWCVGRPRQVFRISHGSIL